MIQSILELRHLQTLLALAETGTLSRAATRIYLTQSAISHQIKQLEDHYGVSLFERKSRPLRLSPAGRRLHTLAETVMKLVGEAERDVARIAQGEAGQLRIAVECHTCFDWLMPAMDRFREHWPEIELDLVSGFHADPLALLLENRAELVVVSEPQPRSGVVFHPLFGFEIVGLVSRQHPFAANSFLKPEDFAEETLISYPVPDEMCGPAPRPIRCRRRPVSSRRRKIGRWLLSSDWPRDRDKAGAFRPSRRARLPTPWAKADTGFRWC